MFYASIIITSLLFIFCFLFKIEKLVESVRNLKSEQTQVEQQLDFILSQQKDLDECLASLEDEVSSYFPEIPADDM